MNHKQRFLALTILALGAGHLLQVNQPPKLYASRLAGMKALAVSGMQIVNLDAVQPASVLADFYKQGAGQAQPVSVTLPPIGPLSSASMTLPNTGDPTGGLYSALIAGDRRLAAVVLTEWPASGARAMYNAPEASTDVTLPLVLKDSFGHSSLVTVHNTDPQAGHVIQVMFTRTGEPGPRLVLALRIPAGESRTLDLARDGQLGALPSGFFGTVRAVAEVPVAVHSDIDVASSFRAVYGFVGVPQALAAETLYVPLFVARQAATDGSDTLLAIANAGEGPVAATVTVRGMAGPCQGRIYHTRTGSIAPGSNILLYRWPASLGMPMADVVGLPQGCIGAATVQADPGGRLLATVAYLQGDVEQPSTAGGYNAFSAADAGRLVVMPLYRNQHTKDRMTTAYQVMNLGPETAKVHVNIVLPDGLDFPPQPPPMTIGPGEAASFYPPAIAALTPGKYGSASVHSDQPIAVVAVDASLTNTANMGIYRGVAADAAPDAPGATPTARPPTTYVPVVASGASFQGPSRPTPDAVVSVLVPAPHAAVRLYLPLATFGDH